MKFVLRFPAARIGDWAAEAGVSMRSLDRALWQYSRERQP
jgi:hypothetical protein